MSGSVRRVSLEPAYLLHHYAYRDTSRILELLTRGHGRVSVFARAAHRAGSALPAVLQPFTPLLVSWSGRGEAGRLTGAERRDGPGTLPGGRLMAGFYVNELLIRLLPRQDPHAGLFEAYERVVAALGDPRSDPARGLRLFEKRLLEELGYGLDLSRDAQHGRELVPERSYRYRLESGPVEVDGVAEGTLIFSGASLLSLAREELADSGSLGDAHRLLRAALDACLEGRGLRTRDVAAAMRARRDADTGG